MNYLDTSYLLKHSFLTEYPFEAWEYDFCQILKMWVYFFSFSHFISGLFEYISWTVWKCQYLIVLDFQKWRFNM